jgi:hypothetical protein
LLDVFWLAGGIGVALSLFRAVNSGSDFTMSTPFALLVGSSVLTGTVGAFGGKVFTGTYRGALIECAVGCVLLQPFIATLVVMLSARLW